MKSIVSAFLLVSVIFLPGCGKKSDGNVFVTGTVTQGGQPIEDARVTFIPEGGSGEAAGGPTDQEGKYVLTTSMGKEGSGTKPGAYRVTVSKTKIEWDGKSYLPSMRADEGEEPSKDEKVVQLLPRQYSNYASTPFQATVTEKQDDNVFDFDLK